MDHKGWPWKKKSLDKTAVGSNGEIEKLVADKIELENQVTCLNDKLTFVEAKSNKHETEAQEAIVGWEKTKAEVASLKNKLEEALNEKHRTEERSKHMDAGLKECSHQLQLVRQEHERRMRDTLKKASQEYERQLNVINTELAGTGKRLADAEGENMQLSKALLAKNKIAEDLSRERDRIAADFNALVRSLESKEKENVSLRYEVRVLEKELELRNEEKEFSRQNAEASHKLHLENVKKIAKLESECQRLRILVRKRLPGPAALSKIRNEVEVSGRRRVNGSPNMMIDSEKINSLTEKLSLLDEENKTLREALNKKVSELQFSRNMYSRTASRLLEFESHLEESSKGTNIQPSPRSNVSHEVSVVSVSEFDNDDKVSCTDSWASALLSELDHFKKKKLMGSSLVGTPTKASEMELLDDFAEMEKLASTTDNQPGSSPICSSDSIAATGLVENISNENLSEATKTPGTDYSLNPGTSSQDDSVSKLPQSLHIILKAIMEHKRITQRNTDDVLEDIKKALSSANRSSSAVINHQESVNMSQITPQVSLKQTKTLTLEETPDMVCDISKSIHRIIEIIEGVSLEDKSHVSNGESERLSAYTARVLQWKTTELSSVLQRFLHNCYDTLDRKADMKKFAEELSSMMEWMVNHCFSLQDVSSMREDIKKQFEWDESRSGSEVDIGTCPQVSEADKHRTEDVSFSACKDQLIEDKPGNQMLSSKTVEEEANDKTLSASAKELKLEEKQSKRTELEITAASEKLAECQETILNLGKQLKALTNSKESALLSNKLMSELTDKSSSLADAQPSQKSKPEKRLMSQRSSLLDQMKLEDDDTGDSKDEKPQAADKNGKGGNSSVYSETIEALEQILLSDKRIDSNTNCFAIAPQKKSGGVKSLWRKLLGRKNKGQSNKFPYPFAT